MYRELAEFYQQRIFDCTRCQQSLLNPYNDLNPKHDDPKRTEMPQNRRNFQLEYINSKRDITIVIIGEAPGLDGCGYGGIAFTGEHNAVEDLGLPNFHGTNGQMQREQSANLIYGSLAEYCQQRELKIPEAARKLYLTNAIMCVPLGKNGRSITAPNTGTKRQCKDSLLRQLEIINPQAVVTLGANALNAVADAYGVKIPGKLTDLVAEQRKQGTTGIKVAGFSLIPEIHPSPRNRVLGDLYLSLPHRLVQLFNEFMD